MQIRVLLFASLRDAAQTSEVSLALAEGSSAGAVLSELAVRLPGRGDLLDRCALAVNAEYAESTCVLSDGDTVAVIPPVSGGSCGI